VTGTYRSEHPGEERLPAHHSQQDSRCLAPEMENMGRVQNMAK